MEETKGSTGIPQPEMKDNTGVRFNTIKTTKEEIERMAGYFKKNIESFVKKNSLAFIKC